jgi:predicted PurR-regulated permease PerM
MKLERQVLFWDAVFLVVDRTPIILIAVVGVICGALDSYVLSPYLVGRSVGLHPVWLMFALFTFSYLFGFLGLLVAIPVSAAVAVLVRFMLRQYLTGRYYTGEQVP